MTESQQRVEQALRCLDAGDLAGAARLHRELQQQVGETPEVLHLAGMLAMKRGDLVTAGRLVAQARAASSAFRILADHGLLLAQQGQLREAVAELRQALEQRPGEAVLRYQLAKALHALHEREAAARECEAALAVRPDLVDARKLLGAICFSAQAFGAALEQFTHALAITPDSAQTHNNIGLALSGLGRHAEAVQSFRKALALKPDFIAACSNMLFCLTHVEDESAESIFAAHRAFGQAFTPLAARWPAHANTREPGRPLRLGFVSADLWNHPVADLIEEAWTALDKACFGIHVYYNNVIEDAMTARLKACAASWRAVQALNDQELSSLIQADGIDILFDLSGHTAGNRLPVFARKPAPVQASWIGYPATTGLAALDYYLADRFLAPPGRDDGLFTEKIVRLPAICRFRPEPDAPPANALPACSNGYFTFGSFNRNAKLGDGVVALWSNVLHAVPGSRMLLGAIDDEAVRASLIARFAARGVDEGRLQFHSRTDRQSYLRLHHQVDLILDTFPYSGGTTSAHALWMGVPALTLSGQALSSRQTATLLQHFGLSGFIAESEAGFVQAAADWAGRLDELNGLRLSLRARISDSRLFDPGLVARGLERAASAMWQRWCDGLTPESFELA